MEHLEEFLKRCPHGIWKWPDGSERLDSGSYGISRNAVGDIYAISSGGKRWKLVELPNSCLKRHECECCGRRGKRGFIYEEWILELNESKVMCLGCRNRYGAMRRKIEQCNQLGVIARRNLRNLKGISDEASKNNARTA